jgi:hypothetical protein
MLHTSEIFRDTTLIGNISGVYITPSILFITPLSCNFRKLFSRKGKGKGKGKGKVIPMLFN